MTEKEKRRRRPPRPDPFGPVEAKLLGALLAVVIAVVVTVAVASYQPEPPSKATLTDSVPQVPKVSRSTELGPIKQLQRISARDNGQSVQYGRESIWVFADTVLRGPWGFLSNSAAATSDLEAADGIDLTTADAFGADANAPSQLIPLTDAERRFEAKHVHCVPASDEYCKAQFAFWPGPLIADPKHHRVLVFYSKLCRGGTDGTPCSGDLGKGLGTGVAAVDMLTHRVTRLSPSNAQPVLSVEGVDPTMFFPPTPGFANGALVFNGDAYLYGDCKLGCHLARVRLSQLTDRSQWSFYAGKRNWTDDQTKAVDAIAAGAAGNTVFWNPALHGWLNVYLPFGSNELTAQIGGSPYGPWSPAFSLLTTDTGGSGTNYAAFAHPEYAQRNGLVQYVSYYQTSTGTQRLLEITLTP
jgi:hypothetical protein